MKPNAQTNYTSICLIKKDIEWIKKGNLVILGTIIINIAVNFLIK